MRPLQTQSRSKYNEMKAVITITPEAIGLYAAYNARGVFNPLKQPKEYKSYYLKIYRKLKRKNSH